MIKIENLEKSFRNEKVLNSINLEIEDGDIFGLVGRSGVGKSTLLRCMNALETYDSGLLMVNGKEVNKLKGMELRTFRKDVGMIFQQFSLTERDTVYQNVAMPMKCWKYDKEEMEEKINNLLEIVELSDRRDQKARHLSGGQKQRVAIARALTLDPSVLLCDEATSALDPNTTQSILELLKEINKKLGITIVVVTHEMSVVRSICNKIAVLDRNGIADVGSVEDVFKHQCPALKHLLGNTEDYSDVSNGRVVRVFSNAGTDGGNVLGKIAKDIGVNLEVLSANVQEYRTGVFGEYIVEISDTDFELLTGYLTKSDIYWEALN